METMRAVVKYYSDYNGREGYAVEIFSEGEYGLDTFFPLVRRENCDEDEERNFVHFGLINKIGQLNRMGYNILFL